MPERMGPDYRRDRVTQKGQPECEKFDDKLGNVMGFSALNSFFRERPSSARSGPTLDVYRKELEEGLRQSFDISPKCL